MTGLAIEVASLNLWLRPFFFPFDHQAARAAEYAQALGDHDVLVLAEAFHHKHCRRLFDTLRKRYPFQVRSLGCASLPRPFGSGLRLSGGGVAIVSRWPIEQVAEQSFRGHLCFSDRLGDKGVLYVRVNKDGRRVHVFGSHTQAEADPVFGGVHRTLGGDPASAFEQNRQANYTIIKQFIDRLEIAAGEPVIVAGDLNVDRVNQPEPFRQMLATLDAALPERRKGHPFTFDPRANSLAGGRQRRWLDYVLYSRAHLVPRASELDVQPVRSSTGWKPHHWARLRYDLSDHFAVIGRFRFPPASELTKKACGDLVAT